MLNHLLQRLQAQQEAGLYRHRLTHQSPQTPELQIEGQPYLNFSSNDYLGLASHPRLIQRWQRSATQFAVGAGASHLVNGHTSAHHELEQALARYTGRSRALLFSTGYMANLGAVTALLGRNDAAFSDKLNHASLVDAVILSRAHSYRYAHNDMEMLQRLLAHAPQENRLIIADGVFSMEGDLADLPRISQLAQQHQAWVMVDDAHGLGVLGATGRGTLEHFALTETEIPVLMGTLGKALGCFGAFVAGNEVLIESLIQFARSYIYTTALPPALAETVLESLSIVEQEHWRREKLQQLIQYFRQQALQAGLNILPSMTPIQGIVLGTNEKVLQASAALKKHHILVVAIRPPTVPLNTARLRITLSALHEKQHIDKLINALSEVLPLKKEK